MESDTITIEDAKHLLGLTDLKWFQNGENLGWFHIVLNPTTVTRVWYEDVREFLASKV